MSDLLMLIDGNNIALRAWSSHKSLSHNGVETGMLYGTISAVRRLVQMYDPTHILWCWDSGKSAYRTEIFPEYKSNRESTGHGSRDSDIAMVDEFLSVAGIITLRHDNTEADDLIASAALQLAGPETPVVIVSGDHDLQQLLSDQVTIHSPNKGGELLTARKMRAQYGVEDLTRLADLWSIMGDTGDGIPGVRGLGPKKSLAIMQSSGWDIDQVVKTLSPENAAIVRRNQKLIRLDGSVFNFRHVLESLRFLRHYDREAMSGMMERYGIKSLASASDSGEFWK